MANDLNRCEFIGRLGGDPDVKVMPNGNPVCKISIAVGEQWKGQDGQRQERTTWVPVVAFGKLAEIMGQYLKKGQQVFIAGKFTVRKWQAQDGSDRYTTEIIASDMQMLGSRQDGGQQQGNAYSAARDGATPQQGGFAAPVNDFDQDIPF